jgi:hypothetical protein
LAQNSFTQEWESPAGKWFWGVDQWERNNSIPEIILTDANTVYVHDGNTKALKYSYENSDTSVFSTFSTISYETPIDVNNDGIFEVIRYRSRSNPYSFSLKIVNGVNGSLLYQNTWSNYYGYPYIFDIDGDGYTEIMLNFYNEQERKLVILSTTSQVIGVRSNTQNAVEYKIEQNYPNPFNPSTIIEYSLSKKADVKITVFDILGREVKVLVNEKKDSGNYMINFEGNGLASGTYFYQITVDGIPETKKMILVK